LIPIGESRTGFVVMATRQGLIKKTSLKAFTRINRNGKIAIKMNKGDDLISVEFSTGRNEIMIASKFGKCIRFHERNVRATGRGTAGVKAMKLEKGDCLVDMLVVDKTKDILTVTSKGYGKRSNVEDYRVQGRAGKGIKAGVFNKVTGDLVNLKQVTEEDDVMIISDSGVVIRMHCSDISRIGRNTKGVRLMRLKRGSVATIALTERDDDEEATAPVETADETTVVEEAED
ncbi:MAG: DNA gyrase subunit A, partial [Clostridia bacterium]|nr:DNA gyrase subunit A [Clostridia bacterium]